MHEILILQLLILLAAANGTPVFAKLLLGDKFATPLDGGALFGDGRPWFGPSKTIRGIVLAVLATTAAAALLGLGWKVGALVGTVAMASDLLSSFVKRRLGLASSSQAIGLDQIPESLFPLVAVRLLLQLSALDVAVATLLFFAGELLLSRLLYKWHVRDRPY
ncbi:MAG TPA: CDP-archaeol synthase [Methyloceanibacter sp.]|nr:CDP-archaeol synthase [Methyloceanibacter sp.]